MTLSGIEHTNFRPVAQRPNQLRHCVPLNKKVVKTAREQYNDRLKETDKFLYPQCQVEGSSTEVMLSKRETWCQRVCLCFIRPVRTIYIFLLSFLSPSLPFIHFSGVSVSFSFHNAVLINTSRVFCIPKTVNDTECTGRGRMVLVN